MPRLIPPAFILLSLLLASLPATARDSLGIFGNWGAFRDPQVPRCYAIAAADINRAEDDTTGFATVSSWPQRGVRGQVHFHLTRPADGNSRTILRIGREAFELTGADADAWAQDQQMDARILAAMRAAGTMQLSATDTRGRRFTDSYDLAGAATAMDAASVGCSGR